MLKRSYIANWKNVPNPIRVARPHILAPSAELLREYKNKEKKLGRVKAWKVTHFERRFREEILNNGDALLTLFELWKEAKSKDVTLMCYEKDWPCHTFVLLDLAKDLFDKVIGIRIVKAS